MKLFLRTLTMIVIAALPAVAGMNVTSPAPGATVANPVRITGNATSTAAVSAIGIYVDSVRVYTTNSATLDATLTLATGTRNVTVQSWDVNGLVSKSSFQLNVTAATTTTTTTSAVTVVSPANGASTGTSVNVVASAAAPNRTISAMGVYVDGVRVYTAYAASLSTTIQVSAGAHSMSVQAWDTTGAVYKQQVSFTATSTSSSTASTTVYTDIEQITGWESCDVCAGIGGNGPTTPYSMAHGRTSPSLDGNSSEFWLGGDTPYAQALWWKQLGGNASARNFVYELDFYIKDPNASQALEFDVNQSVNGKKYIFGTECNLKETRTWRVWDPAAVRWVNTGIACPMPKAYEWNHLVWEFQRTGDDKVRYISVTVNGVKTYVNMTFNPIAVNASEINVAFQMDGDYKQTDHSVWLDNVTLRYW